MPAYAGMTTMSQFCSRVASEQIHARQIRLAAKVHRIGKARGACRHLLVAPFDRGARAYPAATREGGRLAQVSRWPHHSQRCSARARNVRALQPAELAEHISTRSSARRHVTLATSLATARDAHHPPVQHQDRPGTPCRRAARGTPAMSRARPALTAPPPHPPARPKRPRPVAPPRPVRRA
jgi:hypothetical protein